MHSDKGGIGRGGRGGGEGEGIDKEECRFPAIISALIGPFIVSPSPLHTINERDTDIENDNSVINIKQTIDKINDIEILQNTETPSQLFERRVCTHVPKEIEKREVADVVTNFLAFVRLTAFRGNPNHSSGMEHLSVNDIVDLGLQQNTLTVDMVLGKLIIKIFQFNSTYAIDSSSGPSCPSFEKEFYAVQNLFSSVLRDEFLHSLIATVAGNVRASNAAANSLLPGYSITVHGQQTNTQKEKDLLWSEMFDDNEMDEECLRSSHEYYAQWATDLISHTNASSELLAVYDCNCVYHNNYYLLNAF